MNEKMINKSKAVKAIANFVSSGEVWTKLKDLLAENEKLKEINASNLKSLNNFLQENNKLKERVKQLDEMTGIYSVRLMEKYKQALEEVEKYCNECNLKADYTACEILTIIDEVLN